MGYAVALLAIACYLFYFALILRLVFDWVQSFAPYWRPRGAVLVLGSAVNAVTDPPLRALRKVLPSLNLGGLSLDVGYILLFIVVSFINAALTQWTYSLS